MSIGPTKTEDQQFKPSIIRKTSKALKDNVSSFFHTPAYYLFWTSFTICMVMQFGGYDFNASFYWMLTFLGIFSIYEKTRSTN
jgi:hypothetical protein